MSDFNYKDKTEVKLTDEFKQKFTVNIKGKDAIKVEGLLAYAHNKGFKSLNTDIIQFPNKDNNWTCICKTVIVGYDWDPINEKICEVTFSDIADANELNCTSMVKASYIRMASTRSIGRALRKYTNIDMVCSAELSDITEESEQSSSTTPLITTEMLEAVKTIVGLKGLSKEDFSNLLFSSFQTTNYMALSLEQGNQFLSLLSRYQKETNANQS